LSFVNLIFAILASTDRTAEKIKAAAALDIFQVRKSLQVLHDGFAKLSTDVHSYLARMMQHPSSQGLPPALHPRDQAPSSKHDKHFLHHDVCWVVSLALYGPFMYTAQASEPPQLPCSFSYQVDILAICGK
jgi:hypothetical protein